MAELPVTVPVPIRSARDAAPSVQSLEQAAQWYATLRDDQATEQDRQAWQQWLQQSAEHAGAWQRIEAVSRRFDPLRQLGPSGTQAAVSSVAAARRAPLNRRRAVNGLAGVLGFGVAGWLGWRHTPLPQTLAALRADHHTGTGERRELTLADGSRVWLNTATALQTDFRADLRRLVLLGGEILIQTAADPTSGDRGSRPFVLDTGFGRLRALGTRFAVRHGAQQTRLDVFDGAVAIRTTAGQTLRVDAGRAARFDGEGIGPLLGADRAREAWSRGRLPADGLPLGELLAELGRYRRGHISVAPEVAGLKVMGVYPTDDTDQALDMLARSLPIRVRRSLPWWTTVEAAG